MKTKIRFKRPGHQDTFKEGEIGYISGHANTDGVPLVAIVTGNKLVYAKCFQFDVITESEYQLELNSTDNKSLLSMVERYTKSVDEYNKSITDNPNPIIRLKQTREIKEFRPVIDNLIPDFDYVFMHTILQWCKLASDPYEGTGRFLEVWLIDKRFNGQIIEKHYTYKTIGLCGLYSLTPNNTDKLWLGWLGIIPRHRNNGHGKDIMKFLYEEAKKVNCKEILSYVGKEGKPLNFYKREGFEILGTVKEYLASDPLATLNDFEDENDYVIRKKLSE